jgi:predicted nucleotidyltransferase
VFDRDRVLSRIADTEAYLADVERFRDAVERQTFLEERGEQYRIAFPLQQAIQGCLDIAAHWVASEAGHLLPVGARAWLVGSLAWGGFGPRSDVDLVLDGVSAAVATDIELAVARAANAPVDLLDLGDLPGDFRERVLAEGVALHGDE